MTIRYLKHVVQVVEDEPPAEVDSPGGVAECWGLVFPLPDCC